MTRKKTKVVYLVYNETGEGFWCEQYDTQLKAKEGVERNGCDDEEYYVFEARLVASSPGLAHTRKWIAK